LYRIPSPKLPKSPLTRRLSLLKYGFLTFPVIVLPLGAFVAYGLGEPFFCKFLCPAGTLEAGLPLVLLNAAFRELAGGLFILKLALLAACVAAAVFIFRPFCRFACPLGAIYGLFNRYALWGIRRDRGLCTNCGSCAEACKMDTRIANDRECIRCGDCIRACPAGALSMPGTGPSRILRGCGNSRAGRKGAHGGEA
jgi:polyferredoxin